MPDTANTSKGFMLAITTAVMWGLLPLALKLVLNLMDAYTITWYRFVFAAIFVGFVLSSKRKIPFSILKNKAHLKKLILSALFLSLNYIMYLVSLHYVPAETAQMLIQMAPFFMIVGSVVFIKEHFTRGQFIGSLFLVTGLLLFFNQQFSSSASINNDNFTMGFIIIFGAAVTWATYAIIQKQMLKAYGSNQIMWGIYLLSSFFFLPWASPMEITTLDTAALLLLLFCCANTLIAYGTFAKAQEYLPTSNVTAILAVTPLLTVFFATMAEQLWPSIYHAQQLNGLAYIGGGVVVFGSIVTAQGDKLFRKLFK